MRRRGFPQIKRVVIYRMNMKPYFFPIGKPSGDATRNYRVDGVKGYFVHEFIDYIQENNKEWGTININTGDKF